MAKLMHPPYYILHFGRICANADRAEQELARAALDRDCHAVAALIADAIDERTPPSGHQRRSRLANAVELQIMHYNELHRLVHELLVTDEDATADIELARLWLSCIIGLAMRHPDECRRALAGNLRHEADARDVRSAGQLVDVIPWHELHVDEADEADEVALWL